MGEVAAGHGNARPIGVAVIGFGWMGRVHSQAYARVRHHFPDLPLVPELVAVADEVPGRAEHAAAQFGFTTAVQDWREVLADSRVEAVSVTAPNWLHREIGVAVAEAGRHLWIEKPVGVTADDARAVGAAVDAAGVQSAVGFNYRNAPAVAMAREMLAAGEIGRVTHARFYFLSDYAASPEGALTWRYERAPRWQRGPRRPGLARAWTWSGTCWETSPPWSPTRPSSCPNAPGRPVRRPGTREWWAESWARSRTRTTSARCCAWTPVARVVLEASRVAVGEQNAYGFEIHGSMGALSWDFRRMGELAVSRGRSAQDLPVATMYVGPGTGHYAAFQPGAGIAMGYDDLKVIEAHDFLLLDRREPPPRRGSARRRACRRHPGRPDGLVGQRLSGRRPGAHDTGGAREGSGRP